MRSAVLFKSRHVISKNIQLSRRESENMTVSDPTDGFLNANNKADHVV